jgi:hypothetical protein
MKKILNYLISKVNSEYRLFYFIILFGIILPFTVIGIIHSNHLEEFPFWPFSFWFMISTSFLTYLFKKNKNLK